ncbi:MAG: hypothetical protein ACYCW6_08400 [Candidatus Xenobia bacterium]
MKTTSVRPKRTPWQSEAFDRWPKAAITGDGPYALRIPCGERYRITLYKTLQEAQIGLAAVAQGCGQQYCKVQEHTIRDLQIPRQ